MGKDRKIEEEEKVREEGEKEREEKKREKEGEEENICMEYFWKNVAKW